MERNETVDDGDDRNGETRISFFLCARARVCVCVRVFRIMEERKEDRDEVEMHKESISTDDRDDRG